MNEIEKETKISKFSNDILSKENNKIIDYIDKLIRSAENHTIADEKAELGVGCKYEHTFTPGLYVRKMFLPKDTIFVTRVHKTEHPYFIMQGDVSVYIDGEMIRLKAPYQGITKIGTRRALRTHEDTVWITIHVTEKTNLEEIVNDLATETVEEYELWQRQLENKKDIKILENKEV